MTPGPWRLSSAILLSAGLLLLAACSPPEHVPFPPASPSPSLSPSPTPQPTPTPSPTPIYVPEKRLDTGRLFNGIQFQASFSTEPGGTAVTDIASPSSYSLRLNLDIHVPYAASTQAELVALNPSLPSLLPALPDWLKAAKVSPLYERLYRHKIQSLQRDLLRLDALLSRHDFYDCETILELQPPASQRKVLWIQSAMDVDSDGSDSDRVPGVDANSQTFQPMTSYKWPKRGAIPNPFAAQAQARLDALEASLDRATSAAQREQIKDEIGAAKYEVRQLTVNSFLVAATDPYVVIPFSVLGQKDDPFSPGIGDYCAVICGNVIYPALVGDVGPASKAGEASLRIAQEINPLSTSENRPISALKVTYLVFPGTAEHPFSPPDLDHWHARVDALLKEAGGYNGQLFVWKDLTVPPPTPTPSPTPLPSPTATGTDSASPAPSPSPSPTASPSSSPSP